MMLLPLEPVTTPAELAAWAVQRIRYGHESKRWLLAKDERGCWLVHREKAPAYSRDKRPREDWQRISPELHARLAARWPRQRNEGLSYLTAAGIVDLVGHSGPVKEEAKRLRALDEARAGRRRHLEREAERAFEALQGVPELEAAPTHRHDGRRVRAARGDLMRRHGVARGGRTLRQGAHER